MHKNKTATSQAVDGKALAFVGTVSAVFSGLIFGSALWSQHPHKTREIGACSPEQIKTVDAVVRQAGTDFFASDGSWRFLQHGCDGRLAAHCRANRTNLGALEGGIGKPVVVEMCHGDIIAYSINGQRPNPDGGPLSRQPVAT